MSQILGATTRWMIGRPVDDREADPVEARGTDAVSQPDVFTHVMLALRVAQRGVFHPRHV